MAKTTRSSKKVARYSDPIATGSSTVKVTPALLGLPTAMERGTREFGALYIAAVQEATTLMGYATRGGIDELGTPRPKADPLDVLPSVVYDVFSRLQGLAPFTAESQSIPEVSRTVTRTTTARQKLGEILDDFLNDCEYARMTGRGLNTDGRVRWSFVAEEHALARIEQLFDRELPRPWVKPDSYRMMLEERVRTLEAQLRVAVGHGTEKPLPDHVAQAMPEQVKA